MYGHYMIYCHWAPRKANYLQRSLYADVDFVWLQCHCERANVRVFPAEHAYGCVHRPAEERETVDLDYMRYGELERVFCPHTCSVGLTSYFNLHSVNSTFSAK